MSTTSSSRPTGRRILGFGKHPEIAAAVQEKLGSLGLQATIFALTNDEAGDARLVAERKRAEGACPRGPPGPRVRRVVAGLPDASPRRPPPSPPPMETGQAEGAYDAWSRGWAARMARRTRPGVAASPPSGGPERVRWRAPRR